MAVLQEMAGASYEGGDPNSVQHGGDHYSSEYQHWDWVENNGIGYLEAAATKYVSRWRKKHGVVDLEKALHYVDKLADLHVRIHRLPRGFAPMAEVLQFCRANELEPLEAQFMMQMARWCELCDLRQARSTVVRLLDMANAADTSTDDDDRHRF